MTVDDVLVRFACKVNETGEVRDDYIVQAKSQFLSALLTNEGVPKDIDMGYTGDNLHDTLRDIRNEYGEGFNQSNSQWRNYLKKELGE